MRRTGKVSPEEAAAASDMMVKKRKKKGRPSLIEIQKRNLLQQQLEEKALITSNPNFNHRSSPEIGDDDDDDERKEKKVKLVVRLPQSNNNQLDNLPLNSASFTSGSNDEGDNPETSVKRKRKSNAAFDRSGDDLVTDQGAKIVKVTDTLHGSQLESGPTTPLPDKKLLVFILDRLQKKDTYGVFSEPVDPNELPDYHEIIEHPMDFGTVRRKLDAGLYLKLEELEADVFLICSNAMQYNSSDTVYFRQARTIQDLAKRDFENLRHEGDDGELQPKVVRRGRPPGKQQKKLAGSTSADRIGPELSSGATLATGEDNTNGSGAYNLRKAPMVSKFLSADATFNSYRPRNGENYYESSADWNNEFPASILRADMKYGKKHFSIDDTRRDTYKQFHPFGNEPSLLSNLGGDRKQSMPVGLHFEHSYARSLARFAGDLGPVAWKVASKKLESVLPRGVKFGHGFVGESESSPQPPFFSFEKQRTLHNFPLDENPDRPVTPSTTGANPEVIPRFQGNDIATEMYSRFNSQDLPVSNTATFPCIRPDLTFHTHQKRVFHPDLNGLNGVLGHNIPSRMGLVRENILMGQSSPRGTSFYPQTPGLVTPSDFTSTPSTFKNIIDSEEPNNSDSLRALNSGTSAAPPDTDTDSHKVPEAGSSSRQPWQVSFPHARPYSLSVQPDLNVQLQGQGSPSSRLIVGSPQQPDLVLQL